MPLLHDAMTSLGRLRFYGFTHCPCWCYVGCMVVDRSQDKAHR